MAITHVVGGTSASKSGLTETISNVTLSAGDLLVVCVGYETPGGNPTTVEWGAGQRELKIVENTTDTRGDTRCRQYRMIAKSSGTRDVVATWGIDPTARGMTARVITGATTKDQSVATNLASTTAPDTGSAGTSTVAETISIGCFVTGGPSSDTQGAAGNGHTLGQRVGTTGGGAGSNITVQETYEILAATGDIRASLTGITSRICACSVAAFRARQTYTLDRIEEPLMRSGVYKNKARVFFKNEASQDVEEVLLPVNLVDFLTDDEILQFCAPDLVQIEDLAEGEDVQVEAIPSARKTSLEGSTVTV